MELPKLLLNLNLPAVEYHTTGICSLFVFAGGCWHSWDLPCKDGNHGVANGDDVKKHIDELNNKEKEQ